VEKGQAQAVGADLAAVDSVTVRRQGPVQGQAEGVADAATVRAAVAKASVVAGVVALVEVVEQETRGRRQLCQEVTERVPRVWGQRRAEPQGCVWDSGCRDT
jgi:hypothetical protein